ncbi:MAG: NUDIX hydrolase [Proteobacteria bacterium]|nr:NUDIX hydrolase [Pseudomonadota bacterium]
MHRRSILQIIDSYQREWRRLAVEADAPYFEAEEAPVLDRFRAFIAATPDCCERDSPLGHLTGSALVITPDLNQVLLTLHRKLGKWLQLGGHADGSPLLHEVAMREANEESGLESLYFLPYERVLWGGQTPGTDLEPGLPMPFDFDAHAIPARPGEPAHVHYDVRFLIVANHLDPLVISEESRDLRWFGVEAARQTSQERSMERQFLKLAWLKQRLTEGDKALG